MREKKHLSRILIYLAGLNTIQNRRKKTYTNIEKKETKQRDKDRKQNKTKNNTKKWERNEEKR